MAICNIEKEPIEQPIEENINSIFDEYKTSLYHRYTDGILGKVFTQYVNSEGWTPSDIVDPDNFKTIKKVMKDEFGNIAKAILMPESTYATLDESTKSLISEYRGAKESIGKDILFKVLPKFDTYIEHYFRNNPILSIPDNYEFVSSDDTEDVSSDEAVGVSPIDQQELKENTRDWDKDGQDTQFIELLDKDLILALKNIRKQVYVPGAKAGEEVQLYKDMNGMPVPMDLHTTFNLLMFRLNNTRTESEMLDLLKSESLQMVVPEANSIIAALKLEKPNLSFNEWSMISNFYRVFSKSAIMLQTVKISKDNLSFVNDEIFGNTQNIKSQFSSNFYLGKTLPAHMQKYIGVDSIKGNYIESIPENLGNSIEARVDFLKMLGIHMVGSEIIANDPTKNAEWQKLIIDSSEKLYNCLKYRRDENGKLAIFDPITELSKKVKLDTGVDDEYGNRIYKTSLGEKSAIEALVDFESRYSILSPSMSMRNSNGELQYLISLDHQLSIATYHLNKANSIDELLKTSAFGNADKNPLFRRSDTINRIFDPKTGLRKVINGVSYKMDLTNLSGFKQELANKTLSTLERDLTPGQKMIQDWHMFISTGGTDIMRPETSNSFFSLRIKDSMDRIVRRYFSGDFKDGNFFKNTTFKNQMLQYLLGERERVLSFGDMKALNPKLTDDYGKFSIFHYEIEHDPALKKRILESSDLKKNTSLQNEVFDRYNKSLNEQASRYKDYLLKYGVTDDKLLTENVKDIMKKNGLTKDHLINNFVASTMIQNIEFSIMYSGDPLFFNKGDKGEYNKRIKSLSSTGDLLMVMDMFNRYRQSDYEKNFQENYSMSSILGSKYNILGYQKSNKGNSDVFNTQTIKEALPKGKQYFMYAQDWVANAMAKAFKMRDGENTPFTQELIQQEILDRNEPLKQKIADGQGFLTVDGHREVMQRAGYINPNMEVAYKYEGLVLREMMDNISDKQKEELASLEKKIFENPQKYQLNVLKGTYFGGIANDATDGKAMDKFALMTLLPSDVKNNPILKKLMIDMVKGGHLYTKYESGTKLYRTQAVDIDKLAEYNKPDKQYTELFKVQIAPKSKSKDYTAIPTQKLKLAFTNLFNSGIPLNEKVGALYNDYIDTLTKIKEINRKSFLKSVGVKDDEVEIGKLSEKLIEQAKRQGMNSNVIKALSLKDGEGFEHSGFIKQVIDLVGGGADKSMRRYTLSGGDYVMVSNVGREALNFYRIDPITGETLPMDVRITLGNEHAKMLNIKHPDGEKIGTLKRLNDLLKDEKWRQEHKKELTITLDRVPIQGPNAMEHGLIKEFLNPTMGNTCILPDEIVMKSGADFDNDKQKVLLPSLDQNGKYISIGFDTDVQGKRNDFLNSLQDAYPFMDAYQLQRRVDTEDISRNEAKKILITLDLLNKYHTINIRYGFKDAYKDNEDIDGLPEFLSSDDEMFFNKLFTKRLDGVSQSLDYETNDYIYKLKKNQEIKSAIEAKFIERGVIPKELINSDKIYKYSDDNLKDLKMSLSDFEKALYNRENSFEHHANKLIENYTQTLSLPEMFGELVLPNSVRNLRPIADNLAERNGVDISLPKYGHVFDYTKQLMVKDVMFNAKNMLAVLAKSNTLGQLLQYMNIDINKTYSKGRKSDSVINHLLLNDDEISKIDKDGKILTSLKTDIYGRIKQHYLSEGISATADSGKDPWFAIFNIVKNNVSVVTTMLHMGYPIERVLDFINHPIIKGYIDALSNSTDKNATLVNYAQKIGLYNVKEEASPRTNKAHYDSYINQRRSDKNPNGNVIIDDEKTHQNFVKDAKGNYVPDGTYSLYAKVINTFKEQNVNDLKGILRSIDKGESTSHKYIDELVGIDVKKYPAKKEGFRVETGEDGVPVKIYEPATEAYSETFNNFDKFEKNAYIKALPEMVSGEHSDNVGWNIRTLAHFIVMDEHSKSFMNFQNYFDFDTKKIGTPTDINDKERTLRTIYSEKMFDREKIDNATQNSIVGAFNNNETLSKVFKTALPLLSLEPIQERMSRVLAAYSKNFKETTPALLRKMPLLLNTDFMTSLLFNNVVDENGVSFIDKNLHLLVKGVVEKEANSTIKKLFEDNEDIKKIGTPEMYAVYNDGLKDVNSRVLGEKEDIDGFKAFVKKYQTMGERLRNLREMPIYEKLSKQFPILDTFAIENHPIKDSMYEDATLSGKVIHSVKMMKDPSLTVVEENGYIQNFRDLLNYDFAKDKTYENYTKEDAEKYTKAIQDFTKKLFITGLLQSGINKSAIGYSELIPEEFTNPLFEEAINTFKTKMDNDPLFIYRYMDEYNRRFSFNNPKYFPTLAIEGIDPPRNPNDYSNRFKYYRIGIEEKREIIPDVKKENINDEPLKSMSEIVNHSGGAYGADTYWDLIGREFGVTKHNHYREESNASLSKQLRDKDVKAVTITPSQLEEGYKQLEKVFGKKFNKSLENDLKARNFFQVKNADAVYAIAELESSIDKSQPDNITNIDKSVKSYKFDKVSGGTNAAIQMSIAAEKPTYVWDTTTKSWYRWNNDKFIKTETPTLTKNFAGIGTRDIENYNTKNKEGVWEPRESYKGKEVEDAARQAIRDVYEKTEEFINSRNKESISEKENNIYPQLGNKTGYENVVIKSWGELKNATKAITPEGIISTRIPNTNEHFGNPFSHDPAGKTQGLIKTETIKEAVEKYTDWVINSQDERVKWIRKQLQSGELKDKPILYYKELGEPSHATALDYLINKYDWNTQQQSINSKETPKEEQLVNNKVYNVGDVIENVFGDRDQGIIDNYISDGFDWKLVEIPISEIKPNHPSFEFKKDEEKFKYLDSIKKEGVNVPLILNKDNKILDGNHRYYSAKEAGITFLKVYKPIVDEIVNKPDEKSYTIKQLNSIDAKALYKAINKMDVATDSDGLAMEYFIGGGKISPETLFNEVLTKRDSRLAPSKSQTKEEISSRDYIEKGGKTIKEIAHNIWDNLSEETQSNVSETDLRNSLIDVISMYNKRFDIGKEYYSKYNISENDTISPDNKPQLDVDKDETCP